MGINVREKAKALVALLKDDERLRNERVRALKAKERFAQSVSGIGSDSTYVTSSSRQTREPFGVPEQPIASSDLESARPQTVGEEELQLQLALAMSKEEADQEEAKRKSDDVRLQMALSQSEVDYNKDAPQDKDKSALRDLLDINFNPNGIAASSSMSAIQSQNNTLDPWGVPVGSSVVAGATSSGSVSPQNVSTTAVQPKTSLIDIFQDNDDLNISSSNSANNLHCMDVLNDPWSSPASAPSSRVTSPPTTNDPWAPKPKSPEPPAIDDPWAPKPINDPWNPISTADSETGPQTEIDPFAPVLSENLDEFSLISSREKNSVN
ncbi:Sodium-coupled monocarboxylate transporter 2, partial [Armadillidium vulgare]